MDISRRASAMIRTGASSFINISSKQTQKMVIKPLKELFMSVDSSNPRSRLMQRFRLIFLPLISLISFFCFSVRWLGFYSSYMGEYDEVFKEVNYSYDIGLLVMQMSNEKNILLERILYEGYQNVRLAGVYYVFDFKINL